MPAARMPAAALDAFAALPGCLRPLSGPGVIGVRSVLLFFLFLSAVAGLSGCQGKVDFRSPYGEESLASGAWSVGDRAALAEALRHRLRPRPQLWVKAGVVIRRERGGDSEKDFFTATAMYAEPGSIRLRGTRTAMGTLFEVLLRNNEAYMSFPRDGQLFVGTLQDLQNRVTSISGLGPEDLVAGVLVQHDLLRRLEGDGQPLTVRQRGDEDLLVATLDPQGRELFWLVRQKDALVRELWVRDPEGREELRIRYSEYLLMEHEDGFREAFPEKFEVQVPRQGVRVEVDADEYKLDPLPRRAFEPPTGRETYPLSTLRFEEDS